MPTTKIMYEPSDATVLFKSPCKLSYDLPKREGLSDYEERPADEEWFVDENWSIDEVGRVEIFRHGFNGNLCVKVYPRIFDELIPEKELAYERSSEAYGGLHSK
jgi:hypothetical protein